MLHVSLTPLSTSSAQCLRRGRLEIRGEANHHTRDNLVATFACNKLSNKEGFFSTSDPFLRMYRYRLLCSRQSSLVSGPSLNQNQFPQCSVSFPIFAPFLLLRNRCNEDGTYTLVWQNKQINSCLNPRWAQTVRAACTCFSLLCCYFLHSVSQLTTIRFQNPLSYIICLTHIPLSSSPFAENLPGTGVQRRHRPAPAD